MQSHRESPSMVRLPTSGFPRSRGKCPIGQRGRAVEQDRNLNAMTDRVYVFLDESGNLDFGPHGTRYFVLTSVSMRRPFEIGKALDDYRYRCLEGGANLEYFHCYHDRRMIRDNVFNLIGGHLDTMRIDYMVADKTLVPDDLRDSVRFYPAAMERLLTPVLQAEIGSQEDSEVIVITDTLPVNKKRRQVQKAVNTSLARRAQGLQFRVLHHQSRSHYGLQVADYCSWAVYRKHTINDGVHLAKIQPAVRNEYRLPSAAPNEF